MPKVKDERTFLCSHCRTEQLVSAIMHEGLKVDAITKVV